MTNLLNYFDRVRPKKSNKGLAEWEAMCPAHEGSSGERKLVITELDTEYKLYCRSHGCSSDDILAAVGPVSYTHLTLPTKRIV